MATVFYTPGLMELVDSLTRDATAEEDVGHHVRIWSVPVAEELRGKRFGDAFDKFAHEEALVIGLYRKATKVRKASRTPRRSNICMDSGSVGNNGGGSSSGNSYDNERGRRKPSSLTNGGRLSDTDTDTEDSSEDEEEDESDSEEENEDKDEAGHRYVLTSPPASIRLNPSDKLYVIATTDWAWVNVPELIELRKVSAVICLQRRFRVRMDLKREAARSERRLGFSLNPLKGKGR